MDDDSKVMTNYYDTKPAGIEDEFTTVEPQKVWLYQPLPKE